MKHLSFIQLTSVGFILSLMGIISLFGFNLLIFDGDALFLTIALLLFIYQSYFIVKSKHKTGLVASSLIFFLANLAVVLVFNDPLPTLPLNLFFLWLVRCVYFHQKFISMVLDAGLTVLAFATAFWVLENTASWFLTFWSFYLTQALVVFIPQNFFVSNSPTILKTHEFEDAYSNAEQSLKKLSAAHIEGE